MVDLSLVFNTRPETNHNRLPPEKLVELRATLTAAGIKLHEGGAADLKLTELRWLYEPYVHGLASYFRVSLPPWIAEENRVDNWQASTWEPSGISRMPAERAKGEHF